MYDFFFLSALRYFINTRFKRQNDSFFLWRPVEYRENYFMQRIKWCTKRFFVFFCMSQRALFWPTISHSLPSRCRRRGSPRQALYCVVHDRRRLNYRSGAYERLARVPEYSRHCWPVVLPSHWGCRWWASSTKANAGHRDKLGSQKTQ